MGAKSSNQIPKGHRGPRAARLPQRRNSKAICVGVPQIPAEAARFIAQLDQFSDDVELPARIVEACDLSIQAAMDVLRNRRLAEMRRGEVLPGERFGDDDE